LVPDQSPDSRWGEVHRHPRLLRSAGDERTLSTRRARSHFPAPSLFAGRYRGLVRATRGAAEDGTGWPHLSGNGFFADDYRLFDDGSGSGGRAFVYKKRRRIGSANGAWLRIAFRRLRDRNL